MEFLKSPQQALDKLVERKNWILFAMLGLGGALIFFFFCYMLCGGAHLVYS